MPASRNCNSDGAKRYMTGSTSLRDALKNKTKLSIVSLAIYDGDDMFYPFMFGDTGSEEFGFYPYSGWTIYMDACRGSGGAYGVRPMGYNSGGAYAVGEYCVYGSPRSWYQCIVANTGNQPDLSPTKWKSRGLVLSTPVCLAYVYDYTQADNATRLKLYVNGVQHALTFSGTLGANTPTGTTSLPLVGYLPINTLRWDGPNSRHGRLLVCTDALSRAQVQEWMHAPDRPMPGRIAYYNMMGAPATNGSVAELDHSGNGRNLTVVATAGGTLMTSTTGMRC